MQRKEPGDSRDVQRQRLGVSANLLYGFGRFNGSGAILVMRFDLAVWLYIYREDRGFLTTHLHGGYGILFSLITRYDLTPP